MSTNTNNQMAYKKDYSKKVSRHAIYKILQKYSDTNHHIKKSGFSSKNSIQYYLDKDYQMEVDRKTIDRALDELNLMYNIVEESDGVYLHENNVYEKLFLRNLINLFFTKSEGDNFDFLELPYSDRQMFISTKITAPDHISKVNAEVFYNITKAIYQNKNIECLYGSSVFIIKPIKFSFFDNKFWLYAYSNNKKNALPSCYELAKISNVEITNINDYSENPVRDFIEVIKIKVLDPTNDKIFTEIESKFDFTKESHDLYYLNTKESVFISWVKGHLKDIEVIEPQNIRNVLKEISLSIAQSYNKTDEDRFFEELKEAKETRILILRNIDLSKINNKQFNTLNYIWGIVLDNNNIDDFSFLAKLNNLRNLHISNNNIKDISFFTNLKNLSILTLENNNIDDFSFLAEFNNLRELNISNNNIKDISFLTNLKGLSTLTLKNNNITDFPFSTEFTKLYNLKIENNNIKGEFDFNNYPILQFLDLINTEISSIKPYSNNSQLKTMFHARVNSDYIEDFSALFTLKTRRMEIITNKKINLSLLSNLDNESYRIIMHGEIIKGCNLNDINKNFSNTILNSMSENRGYIKFWLDEEFIKNMIQDNKLHDIVLLDELETKVFNNKKLCCLEYERSNNIKADLNEIFNGEIKKENPEIRDLSIFLLEYRSLVSKKVIANKLDVEDKEKLLNLLDNLYVEGIDCITNPTDFFIPEDRIIKRDKKYLHNNFVVLNRSSKLGTKTSSMNITRNI